MDDEINALREAYEALSKVPHGAHPRMMEWLRSRLDWDEEQRQAETAESQEAPAVSRETEGSGHG